MNAVTPQIRAIPLKNTTSSRAGDGGFESCHTARKRSKTVSVMKFLKSLAARGASGGFSARLTT